MADTPTHYDVLVIGSGAAGLGLALSLAQRYRIAILCKEDLLTSSSQYAQGGIAAVMSTDDSYAAHIADTLACGAGLCDPTVVEHTVTQAKSAIVWLMAEGVQFTLDAHSQPHLTQEGGHSHRRILHAADQTGAAVVNTLAEQIAQHPNITCFTEQTSIDLLMEEGACVGATVLDNVSGIVRAITAGFTVLATGGASRAYLHTSNPGHTTGDGMAMAYRAGARLANLEFNQFHPTCFYDPSGVTFLMTEALRGEGAKLLLPSGEPFMAAYDPRAELAGRDIVARAIDSELKTKKIPYVLLDIHHKPRDWIQKSFPTIDQFCLSRGIDITKEPIPVVPAAHYTCGGIVTNLAGQTDIPRLYAIGEVACTGLHGANRMASNSLLECLVFAKNAAQAIEQQTLPQQPRHLPKQITTAHTSPSKRVAALTQQVRTLVWEYVGIVRNNERLAHAAQEIQKIERDVLALWEQHPPHKMLIELRNLTQNAKGIIESARARKESRGTHYTTDYPEKLETACNTILSKTNPLAFAQEIHSLIQTS